MCSFSVGSKDLMCVLEESKMSEFGVNDGLVETVKLLTPLPWFLRYDTFPFLIAYALLLGAIASMPSLEVFLVFFFMSVISLYIREFALVFIF
jgi:hypothetical protein